MGGLGMSLRYSKREINEMEAVGELYVCPTCDNHRHVDDRDCGCDVDDDTTPATRAIQRGAGEDTV